MASVIYPKYKKALLQYTTAADLFDIGNSGTALKAMLVATAASSSQTGTYVQTAITYNATHEYIGDLQASWSTNVSNSGLPADTNNTQPDILYGVVGVDTLGTTRTISDTAVFDITTDAVFQLAPAFDNTGAGNADGQASAIVIYRENTTAANSRLIAWLESDYVTGLAVTPNGTDINLNWNASGIFQL